MMEYDGIWWNLDIIEASNFRKKAAHIVIVSMQLKLISLLCLHWSLSEKVPHRDGAVCWHSNDLSLIWAPMKSLDGCWVTQSLAKEGELVKSLQTVDEDFICFCAKCHEFAWRTDLEVGDLVGVRDLGDWLRFITIPEADWAAWASRYQLKLVVFPLAHRCVEAVLGLPHLNTFLLL